MNFVTVSPSSNTLVLNNSIFRFASFNTPTLSLMDDPWQGINPQEQKDQLFSIAQLGGKVARTYVFSVPATPLDKSRHIIVNANFGTANVQWSLNEALMQIFDSALQIANQLDIKLIIPFVDEFDWWGGTAEFSKLYGKSKSDFFVDPTVRSGWKLLIQSIMNRNNTLTGTLYKNDPAILAWETGNELNSPPGEWTIDTANYIKSLDSNHLIMDGSYGSWPDEVLRNPNISIVSNHYYPGLRQFLFQDIVAIFITGTILVCFIAFWVLRFVYPKKNWINSRGTKKSKVIHWILISLSILSFATTAFFSLFPVLWRTNGISLAMEQDAARAKNKVFIVGETGLFPTLHIQSGLNTFVNQPETSNIAGFLVWSIRGHSKDGGFYTHQETIPGYYSYHYPGFPESPGFGPDEVEIMSIMKQAIAQLGISGLKSLPDPPYLINVKTNFETISFSWFGCSGCTNYTIFSGNEIVLSGLLDNYAAGKLLVSIPYKPFNLSSLSIQGFGAFGETVKTSYKI